VADISDVDRAIITYEAQWDAGIRSNLVTTIELEVVDFR